MDDDGQDPDLIYYNCTILNNRQTSLQDAPNPQIRFQETRSIPILKDASKYNFSIIRFTMNGPNKDLPMFIPQIRTGAENPTNDINLTIYSVSMMLTISYTVGGQTYTTDLQTTQPLIYVPETQNTLLAPLPSATGIPTGQQDINTRYYWVYTYSHWLEIVNAALAACITNSDPLYPGLQELLNVWWAANASGTAPTLTTSPCYMTYNPTTNLFSLYADRYSFGGDARLSIGGDADEAARLFFNNNMFGMFANFNNTYYNYPNELTNEILVYPILYQNIVSVASPPAPASHSYWVMVQDYESTSTLWSPVDSIVFTSSLLPLVFEQTGDPVQFGQSIIGQQGNTQSAFAPIVTDVALVNQNASDYRTYIQYAPTAEYRLASFQRSKQSINNIDIQVFWKNRLDNQLYPVNMFNGSSVSIKCMFRRRGAMNVPHPQTIQLAMGQY